MLKYFFTFSLVCCLFGCTKDKLILDSNEVVMETSDRLNQVVFLNNEIGFVVGGEQFSNPTMFKTINGGLTWNKVVLPTNGELKEIYNIATQADGHVYTVGYGGTMFVSADTGNSFNYVQHHSWKELKDIAFHNKLNGIIIGGVGFNYGLISECKIDGSGSNITNEEKNFELSDIDFTDSSIGYISGYGGILKTIDGGQHWDFTSAKNDFFKAMTWKNSNEGVAVGYEGSIIKTTNGGETWQIKRNGNDLSKSKIHFLNIARNGVSTVVAVGEKGAFFVSKDDGETWVQANQISLRELRGVTFRDDNNCFISGEKGKLFKVQF